MEPLGTITKYYAFIDEETQNILDAVMKEAENYRDFVVRLGDRVVVEELSPMLAYFAVRHAGALYIFDVIDKLSTEVKRDLNLPAIAYQEIDRCSCGSYS